MLTNPPERGNRIILALLGLGLLGAGGYGLARGWGAFGEGAAHKPLLTDGFRTFVHRNDRSFWTVALLAAILVAYVGYRWLRSQLPTTGRSEVIDFSASESDHPGATLVRAQGVASAFATDVSAYPGVAGAAARIGNGQPVAVDLRVELEDGADVEPVRQRLAEHGLPRLRQALETDQVDTRMHVRLGDVSRRHLN
jgi:hypothetical protein